MDLKKSRTKVLIAVIVFSSLAVGFVLGNASKGVSAATAYLVDRATLTQLYQAVFNRSPDVGADFHLGRDIKTVLHDISGSPELRYYGALFKSVKAYEEAQRAPGQLAADEKQKYLDLIESSLSTLLAWVETLPDQDPCRATITGEEARDAILAAYQQMNAVSREKAEFGIFNAVHRIGVPSSITLREMCILRASMSPLPPSPVGY